MGESGESETSRETREQSKEFTGSAVNIGGQLKSTQYANFAEGLALLMNLLGTDLIGDRLLGEQKRDIAAQFGGAEQQAMRDVYARSSKGGRGRDARADAMGRRVRMESAGQRGKAFTDLEANAQTLNRNAKLQTFQSLMSGLQLQQQPYFQQMAALTGGSTAQANIAAANAINNNQSPDLGGIGSILGSVPELGSSFGLWT